MKKIIALIVGVILLILIAFVLRIPNFDFKEEIITFEYDNKTLVGNLILPKNQEGPYPLVIFVHGDGAEDRTANGAYSYFFDELSKKGVACFSWDKQGVGESEGNWEHQDMKSRAEEVISAINALKNNKNIASEKIGLMGFSQAGWVMPYVSTLSKYPDFIVSVSGAINVVEQGAYLNELRMIDEGYTNEEINEYKYLKTNMYELIDEGMNYDEYTVYWNKNIREYESKDSTSMTKDRFIFSSNEWPDAREHLVNVTCPVLAIFGLEDLNVDIKNSIEEYNNIFENTDVDYTLSVYENATHALTDYKLAKYSKDLTTLQMILHGKNIYADGFLDEFVNWIELKVK